MSMSTIGKPSFDNSSSQPAELGPAPGLPFPMGLLRGHITPALSAP